MREDLLSQTCGGMERYPERSMVQGSMGAVAFTAKGMKTTCTGGRAFSAPKDTTAFNAKRYPWAKEHLRATHATFDAETGNVHGYDSGHQYSVWSDSMPIDVDRHIDTFVIRDGPIVKTPVWNASAEWFLDRAGFGEAQL